jgi:hypothetical protein
LRPGGVSIPASYTSWLAPLAAAKLWNEAKHSKALDTTLKVHTGEEGVEKAWVPHIGLPWPACAGRCCCAGRESKQAMETAYVVKVHNALPLAPPQPCFTFEHPNPLVEAGRVDNGRYRTLAFKVDQAATLHGGWVGGVGWEGGWVGGRRVGGWVGVGWVGWVGGWGGADQTKALACSLSHIASYAPWLGIF